MLTRISPSGRELDLIPSPEAGGDPSKYLNEVGNYVVPVFGRGYVDYVEAGFPINFDSENVWEDLVSIPGGTPPAGKFKMDFVVAWNVASNNSRISAIRIVVNAIASNAFSRETNSTADIATASTFTTFEVDGSTSISLDLQGILNTGGGAVQFNLLEYRFDFFQVSEP